jgi:hypothetical protein
MEEVTIERVQATRSMMATPPHGWTLAPTDRAMSAKDIARPSTPMPTSTPAQTAVRS